MASSRRRWTGSSSTMRTVSGMGFPCGSCADLVHFRLQRLMGCKCPAASPKSGRIRIPQPRRMVPMPQSASAPKSAAAPKLGDLPEWNLSDLYSGTADPALQRDLTEGDAECVRFEQDFKGRLADLAAGQNGGLVESVKRYEAIE